MKKKLKNDKFKIKKNHMKKNLKKIKYIFNKKTIIKKLI